MIAIVIHGSPSEAYFPPFLVFIPLMIAFVVSKVSTRIQKMVTVLAIVIAGMYSHTLISTQFYAKPIRNLLDAVQWIVKDAKGDPIMLASYDEPADQHTYLDHAKFLIQMYGGTVVEDGNPYIISLDDRVVLPTINILMQQFGYIRVVKKLPTR